MHHSGSHEESDHERERGRRHKKKSKHKKRRSPSRTPSEKGKTNASNVPPGEETEEQYDARLEREENERLAEQKKKELERLKQKMDRDAQSSNGVRFKGEYDYASIH